MMTTLNEMTISEEGIEGNGLFKALIEMGLMTITIGNVKVCGAIIVH